MKSIYLTDETAKRILAALGIREEQPKLAPKLTDTPVIVIIKELNIYQSSEDEEYEEDYDDEDGCDEDEEETYLDFEADKTGRCIHSCPECGKCMLED